MIPSNNHRKKAPTVELVSLYGEGYSCQKIGEIVGMTRQAVWERLKSNGIETRAKKLLPYVIYDGIKFTISNSTGYYRATSREKNISLHRYKYEREVGTISDDYDIHHIDHNKQNNDISNLLCINKSEHTRLHHYEKQRNSII